MSTKRFEVYAPVLIPTLCRFEHFKRCIESLSKCSGAEFTEVYIGLDFPLKIEHEEGYKKICDFIPSIHGFKKVNVYKREKNYGAIQNARELKQCVKEVYDRYIFSEDDNEFAPNFLEFMNAGLERYKDDPNIINICGCTMPWATDYRDCMKSYSWNAFPAKDFNGWGTGYWFSKLPNGSGLSKDKVLHSFRLTYKAFKYGYCMAIDRMIYQLNKDTQLPDVCRRLYCAFNDKYCVFPRISKARSFGFDGTGINSDNNLQWNDVVELDVSSEFCLDDFEIKDYPEVKDFVRKIYDRGAKGRLKIMMEYLLFRVTGKRIYIERQKKQ